MAKEPRLNIPFPEKTRRALKKQAKAKGMTLQGIVLAAALQYLSREAA